MSLHYLVKPETIHVLQKKTTDLIHLNRGL